MFYDYIFFFSWPVFETEQLACVLTCLTWHKMRNKCFGGALLLMTTAAGCDIRHAAGMNWLINWTKWALPHTAVFAISLSCRQVSACSRRSVAKHRSRRRICSHKKWLPEFIDIKLLITCLQWIFLKQTHFRLKEEKTSFAYSPQIGEFEDV